MKNILLVEDDEDKRQLFVKALQEVEYSCNCAYVRNGEQALCLLDFIVPDFVFVAYDLPGMDGLKFLSEIKKLDHLRSVLVILCFNIVDEGLVENAQILGAVACILKPKKVNALASILQRILTMHTELRMFFLQL